MPRQSAKPVSLIIDQIVEALGIRKKSERDQTRAFAETLFSKATLEDLEAQSPEVLGQVLVRAQKALDRKTVKVTALDDDQTLVVISMNNRPFIVDSVLAELTQHALTVHLVVHPVVDGRSVMVVVLSKTDSDARKVLEKALTVILQQVKLVTDDWKPMLLRLEKAIINFRITPPPLPAPTIAEAIQFLEWLADNNFTLLGMRDYSYSGSRKSGSLKPVRGTALGLLKDDDLALMTRGGEPVELTPQIRNFLFSEDPLIITKANVRSPVHRRTHLDYIGIKRYTDDGAPAGEVRLVGLFTSTAYTKSVLNIPVLRHKAKAVLEDAKAAPDSHFGKALLNILETWPRDELFQLDLSTLFEFAQIAAQLDERPRVRVLPRRDKFNRFVSVVTYVPRDRYDSDTRRKMGDYFAEVYNGYLSSFFPAFLENGLTRVHFIIGRKEGKTPNVSRDVLERDVTEIYRTWEDKLQAHLGSPTEHEFPLDYREHISPGDAVGDIARIEGLDNEQQIALDFHPVDPVASGEKAVGLKLFHLNRSIPLSQRVPMLENMGFHVIEESTYDVGRADGQTVFVHDMVLEYKTGTVEKWDEVEPVLREALHAIWSGSIDDDAFNGLSLACGQSAREAGVFRAYAQYLRQVRSRFSIESMAQTLIAHAKITGMLGQLFDARFNPEIAYSEKKQTARIDAIKEELDGVSSSDDDRILRDFLNMIEATLRTNFYASALDEEGTEVAPSPVLAFKVDPHAVNIMPQPVPYREIFVSSPRVEGLHLRFGPVARGGLRWSDRLQDYRTEVLGLVKAQQVKNAVIVPVGSKGGFVPKQLPAGGDRNAWFAEGRRAYQIFISSLLSLTDNLVDGKVVPPSGVRRHDGDDPYFVVAADKGTSSFSDTANAISQARDFWLDDAFASGGSAGYDHKKMGITARGGWEAVKRHFREIEREGVSWDIQTQEFTAAGVGDMSGDVFGNGMLLSKKTRLIAAFDHRDIFIDPDPDAATSYKERQRLFKMARSSWQDYNTDLISKGGGVFSRSVKTIKLSAAAAKAIGFEAGDHTPQEVMNAILKAPVDLMWFGGIGTYIRATTESDADADDRANDAIRVTARELRCRVIGEGANLGVTHPGRIEFNLMGGRCNSDAIDNSAGVNSSDVEVNIKIALASAMKSGKLSRPKRNTLLEAMTETVAELVLRNNYLQTLSISLTERRGMADFAQQQRLMQSLEERGLLDRAVEDLPDDIAMGERQAGGIALTRAEIGVLLAYAKIVALDDLVAGKVPDDPHLEPLLVSYFPPKMQKPYAREINGHRLRREIVATLLANAMINHGGPSFISRIVDRTGAQMDQIASAYLAVMDAFDLDAMFDEIDALDGKINGELQLELYSILRDRIISQTVWFVRYGDFSNGIGPVCTLYRKSVAKVTPLLDTIMPEFLTRRVKADVDRFRQAGVPAKLATSLARLPFAGLIPDITFAAQQCNKPLEHAARVFFAVTHVFRIGRMVQAARHLETTDYYDSLALDRALQSLHLARRDIVVDILGSPGEAKNVVDRWMSDHAAEVERTSSQMAGIVENDQATVSRLTVAANILADLARR